MNGLAKCARKRHFATREEAEAYARITWGHANGMRVKVYKCPAGFGWLIGRKEWGR